MLLHEKKVFVGTFVPRKEREKENGEKVKKFTNVYVKNFGENLADEKLEEVFSKFGKITSYKLVKDRDVEDKEGDDEGVDNSGDCKNKGYGFVSFQDSESAQKAVEELNGTEMFGKTLYVGRAQKKAERQQELRKKFDLLKVERARKYAGINLYVKNLDDSIDDERLGKEFEPYGTVTSARVMTEGGRSKVDTTHTIAISIFPMDFKTTIYHCLLKETKILFMVRALVLFASLLPTRRRRQ